MPCTEIVSYSLLYRKIDITYILEHNCFLHYFPVFKRVFNFCKFYSLFEYAFGCWFNIFPNLLKDYSLKVKIAIYLILKFLFHSTYIGLFLLVISIDSVFF